MENGSIKSFQLLEQLYVTGWQFRVLQLRQLECHRLNHFGRDLGVLSVWDKF
jgi:hypothetical protein